MDKRLSILIGKYAGIAGMLVSSDNVHGQVIYKDVNPDIAIVLGLSGGFPYNLDMDGDGTVDFQLIAANISYWTVQTGSYGQHSSGGRNVIAISPTNSQGNQTWNKVKLIASHNSSTGSTYHSPYYTPKAENLPVNQVISAALLGWASDTAAIEVSWEQHGNGWPYNQDYFAGVKFKINSQWHYGWLRIMALDYGTMILRDFAYEATANTPITSRILSVGIDEPESNLSVTQKENGFSIQLNNSPEQKNISIKNLLGQEVLNTSFRGDNYEFSIPDKGIFIIEVIVGKNIFSKKVFVF